MAPDGRFDVEAGELSCSEASGATARGSAAEQESSQLDEAQAQVRTSAIAARSTLG